MSVREQSFFQSHVSGFLISLLFGVAEPASTGPAGSKVPRQLTKNEGSRYVDLNPEYKTVNTA